VRREVYTEATGRRRRHALSGPLLNSCLRVGEHFPAQGTRDLLHCYDATARIGSRGDRAFELRPGYTIADCIDCGYFEETFNRVIRGGSNTDAPKNVRAALRARGEYLTATNDIGLRCARVP
jgi:hypothetical protein